MMRGTLVVLLLTAGLLLPAPAVQAQAPDCAVWSRAENRCLQQAPAAPGRGAQPLTATTLAAAQAVQTLDAVNSSSPFTIAMMARGVSDPKVTEKVKDAPFFVNISTPFTRAAWIALEARRTFQNPVFPSLDALNANRLVVSVSPGSSLLTVDTIENVVVKHGDTLTKPLRAEVHPTVVQNAVGVKKESAEGEFVFDFSVFDPQYGPLTLVLIGKHGNFEWEMTADDLSKLK
jgi:hypothetical protein